MHEHGKALCEAAVTLAERSGARAIVAVTRGGGTARRLSFLRPHVPILATTDRDVTARRLAQHGSSFRALLDRARCDHATISLNEGRLSITEIAVRIGFADATAFTRSFRRWTGKTPSEVTRLRGVTARCES